MLYVYVFIYLCIWCKMGSWILYVIVSVVDMLVFCLSLSLWYNFNINGIFFKVVLVKKCFV